MEISLNPSIRLHTLISAVSNEATANEAVTALEELVKGKVTSDTNQLASKVDLLEGLAGVRKEIADVRKEIADVRKEISEGKSEMIKWMFIFWIGQVAVTFGFILLFLKK